MYKNQMIEDYIELCIDDLVDKLLNLGIAYYLIIEVIRSYDYNYIDS